MKTRNLILIGGAGLVAAYVIYMRKKGATSAQSDSAEPSDSQSNKKPTFDPTKFGYNPNINIQDLTTQERQRNNTLAGAHRGHPRNR
jgi:hypothetical protein